MAYVLYVAISNGSKYGHEGSPKSRGPSAPIEAFPNRRWTPPREFSRSRGRRENRRPKYRPLHRASRLRGANRRRPEHLAREECPRWAAAVRHPVAHAIVMAGYRKIP